MKRLVAIAFAFGLITVLLPGESFGQRGGRGGGMRGGAGPSPGRGGASAHVGSPGKGFAGPMSGPAGPASPGRPGGVRPVPPGSRPSAAGVGQFLGVSGTNPRTATPARQAVSNWGQLPHQPFTPAWYSAHPNVWQATHPHADLFVAATAVGLAGWLAVPYAAVSTTAYSTGGTSEATASPPQEPLPAEPTETAAPGDEAWMPLGVFALRSAKEPQANLVLQMAVNREGVLRGSQFHTGTQTAENVTGAVDKQSLLAVWRVGEDRQTAFETTLGDLTKIEGGLTLRFSDGRREDWKLIQISR